MPYISRIQRFSPDDGPGVRTTVFFKGCTLNCAWCHNPECLEAAQSIVFFAENCINCQSCGGDRENADVCPTHALRRDGFELSPEEIVAEALRDARYYKNGGGITLSGGEPLMHGSFIRDICAAAKEAGLDVAIDTSLNVPWENIEKVLPFDPLFLADIKAASGDTHKKLTGADNALILQNLEKLAQSGAEYWVSVPVIPHANTHELSDIANIIKKLPHPPQKIRLLPYHDMGIKKEETYSLPPRGRFTSPTDAEMREYEEIFK